jgi:hypothetical protein
VQFILGEENRTDTAIPTHPLFSEMEELCVGEDGNMEWKETARYNTISTRFSSCSFPCIKQCYGLDLTCLYVSVQGVPPHSALRSFPSGFSSNLLCKNKVSFSPKIRCSFSAAEFIYNALNLVFFFLSIRYFTFLLIFQTQRSVQVTTITILKVFYDKFLLCRWVKFEEDVEEGGNRWSKPHVATLSLHSLFELRSLLTSGSGDGQTKP